MTLEQKLTEQFYAWEKRGRGWQVFDGPVSPEPPFLPFYGHYLPTMPSSDDGRQHTTVSSWIERVSQALSGTSPPPELTQDEEEPEPDGLLRDPLVELAISLPPHHLDSQEAFRHFLLNLTVCREPIAFELLGTSEAITPQFAIHPSDATVVRQQFAGYFSEAVLTQQEGILEEAWGSLAESAIVEFGLANEFMLPLRSGKFDLFVGMASALADLQPDEAALFQVIFQPVRHPWAESVWRAVTDGEGKTFFANHPELLSGAAQKISLPLYAAVVRLAAKSDDYSRAWEIVRRMSGALVPFNNPKGNELIPLHNSNYPFSCHEEDVGRRQSRRSGMLLNCDELLGFVHLPSSAVKTAKLVRVKGDSKSAPAVVCMGEGILLGHNIHAGKSSEVRLSREQRVRHTHILGASGTGKSTLLFNLIHQDIVNGEGLAVLDPHGDLIEHILGTIPSHRIDDVVLLDPSDEEYPIGFNILSAHSELEKTLLASDLSSVFKRLSTSWGDQMHSVLNNAILAFLESSQGGTLSDMRRFLLDTGFRERFLQTVSDPEVVYYWRRAFPQLGGNKSIGPLMTRLETFLGPKPIRYMVSQHTNRIDFGDIMDSGKIFLAKLSQGQIGKENSHLLGSLLMSKFQQQAMSRQSMVHTARRPFWLYADEAHHFFTPSMAEILTGARKYNLGLILAHQELRQLQQDSDVAGAVLSNAGTRVVFRVGDSDAKALAEGFTSFSTESLRKLGTGEAICRVERSDFDFNLSVGLPEKEPAYDLAATTREQVITSSRSKYATLRVEVVAEEMRQFQALSSTATKPTPKETQFDSVPLTTETALVHPIAPVPSLESRVLPAEVPKPSEASILPPADMGRGGAQHQSIQQRLKAAAEDLGFRSTIEKVILDGQGSVDLALEKDGFALACEIAITTTTDHEFGNVKKCIKAGFPVVAVISPKADRLNQIEEAVRAGFEAAESERIRYFLPDQFMAWLRDFAPTIPITASAPSSPAERTTRGYKVRRTATKLSEDERKAKEDVALKAIAESMKRVRR
jgi:Type IV secretion-system coupling protein DNA-binding domain